MNNELRKNGFSLTEVLLAVGALAIGMLFIAGVFPVGIHFTTIATERTIAAVVADEAFAKIRLYAKGDPDSGDEIKLDELRFDQLKPEDIKDFDKIFPAAQKAIDEYDEDDSEFTYPSNEDADSLSKQYCWSALLRLTEKYDVNNPPVQVTVFVCRRTSPNLEYREADGGEDGEWPVPVEVEVSKGSEDNELKIDDSEKTFINDGYTIVDGETGRLYRVLQRYKYPDDDKILLDRDWDESDPGGSPDKVWVIPPPANGSRYPCIAVYQKVIRF